MGPETESLPFFLAESGECGTRSRTTQLLGTRREPCCPGTAAVGVVLCQPWRRPGTAAPNCRDLLGEFGLATALGQNYHTRRATEEHKNPAEWTLLNAAANSGLEKSAVGNMAQII